jgi:hypothetical protein
MGHLKCCEHCHYKSISRFHFFVGLCCTSSVYIGINRFKLV